MNEKQGQITFYLALGALLAGLAGLAMGTWAWTGTPKVAYVRSDAVIEQFKGTKEARKKLQQELRGWKAKIDTLSKGVKGKARELRMQKTGMPDSVQARKENVLRQRKQELQRYKRAIREKAEKKKQKITESTLNQINSFIKDYAQSQGYDIVIGARHDMANVLYGNKGIDITREVIEEMNRKYSQ